MIPMLVVAFLLGMFFKQIMGFVCANVEGFPNKNPGSQPNQTNDEETEEDEETCQSYTEGLVADLNNIKTPSNCPDECFRVWQNAYSRWTEDGPCGSVREDVLQPMVEPLFNNNGKCARCETGGWQ